MRGGKQPCFALAAALLLAGCSSSQFRRIDANREIYESWPIEMQQAVLDGKAVVGMTPDMVKMSLGKPTEIVSRSTVPGDDEIWIYRKGGDDPNPSMSPMIGGPMINVAPIAPSIGITAGRGGVNIGAGLGGGIDPMTGSIMGPGMGVNPGVMMPMPPLPPTPVEEREVVFRNGVVYRADNP